MYYHNCPKLTYKYLQRLGKGINLSVERFVTVGETIAEIDRQDMLDACRETR